MLIDSSARESYGPLVGTLAPTDALNASFWHRLTEVFEADDDVFQLYNTRLRRGSGVGACDADCKAAVICDLRAMRAEDNCVSFVHCPRSTGIRLGINDP